MQAQSKARLTGWIRQSAAFRAVSRLERQPGPLRPLLLAARGRWREYGSVYYNVFGDPENGKPRAALSYQITSFILNAKSEVFFNNSNHWECVEIARLLRDAGYIVDAVNCFSDAFAPRKRYDLFFENGYNLDRVGHLLSNHCKTVRYATEQHWLDRNYAELDRLRQLRARRGLVLKPHRVRTPSDVDQRVDALILIGNEAMRDSYSHVACPVFQVPISVPEPLFSDHERDWETSRRTFLWVGGGGMVHKGLDLVLDVFRDLPDLQLHVVGAVDKEKDFAAAFADELYHTPNIKTHGFLNITSKSFQEIAGRCGAMVYPSCSEGTGAVNLIAMAKGLIPIVSRTSCVDVGEGGIVLPDCSITTIQSQVLQVAGMSPDELRRRSRQVRQFVREHHSRARFSSAMRAALTAIDQR